MKRVLVGIDGSETAAAAAAWAARLTRATGAELIAATAWRPSQSEAAPEEMELLRDDTASRLAGEWTEPIRQEGVEARTTVLNGNPDRLLAAALDDDVDLIVIGTHGHSGVAPLKFGSNAHHLAHYTRRPLALIPNSSAAGGEPIRKIVVCVDGSPGSTAAVQFCADVAPGLGATVTAVASEEPFLEWVRESDPRSWRSYLESEAEEWSQPIRDAGVEVEVVVRRDLHPSHALLEAAADAQLLVVGTAGLSSVLGVRIGGTAMQVIDSANVPVVMVPPTDPGGTRTGPLDHTTDQHDDAATNA